MKVAKNLLVGLLLSAVFVACKKDNTEPAFTIHGMWAGKIGTGVTTPSGQYALNIKGGGAIERISYNGSVSATGTWALNGTNFSAMYTYPGGTVVNVNGTLDKGQQKLTGEWENSGNEEGAFYVSKDNN